MSNELLIINDYCEISKTSLKFKGKLTKDQWGNVFSALKTIEGCVQFWIGDALKYREQHWGMYEDVAEESGYDKQTLKNIKSISENVPSTVRNPELSFTHHAEVSKLDHGQQEEYLQKAVDEKWTVRDLREAIKSDERKEKYKAEINKPTGTFDVIYADPPWQYSNSGFEMSAENQYPTMDTDSICALSFLPKTNDNAILFLWATNPLLPDALKVLSAWGFEYKTCIAWVKENHTAGFYVFGQHELLLICTKGSMLPLGDKPKSVVYGPNNKHSKKPEIFYEIIETMYPNMKYAELFARNERQGWVSVGNEL